MGYKFELHHKFDIDVELLYNQIGANNDKDYFTYNQNYLSLLITFNYKIIQKLNMGAGFQIDYLLSSKTKIDAINSGIKESYDPNMKLGKDVEYNSKKNLKMYHMAFRLL